MFVTASVVKACVLKANVDVSVNFQNSNGSINGQPTCNGHDRQLITRNVKNLPFVIEITFIVVM